MRWSLSAGRSRHQLRLPQPPPPDGDEHELARPVQHGSAPPGPQPDLDGRLVEASYRLDRVRPSPSDEAGQQQRVEEGQGTDGVGGDQQGERHGRRVHDGVHQDHVRDAHEEEDADEPVRAAPAPVADREHAPQPGKAWGQGERDHDGEADEGDESRRRAAPRGEPPRDESHVDGQDHKAGSSRLPVRPVHLVQPAEPRLEPACPSGQQQGDREEHDGRRGEELPEHLPGERGTPVEVRRAEHEPGTGVQPDGGDDGPSTDRSPMWSGRVMRHCGTRVPSAVGRAGVQRSVAQRYCAPAACRPGPRVACAA